MWVPLVCVAPPLLHNVSFFSKRASLLVSEMWGRVSRTYGHCSFCWISDRSSHVIILVVIWMMMYGLYSFIYCCKRVMMIHWLNALFKHFPFWCYGFSFERDASVGPVCRRSLLMSPFSFSVYFLGENWDHFNHFSFSLLVFCSVSLWL